MEFIKYHGTGNDFVIIDGMVGGPFMQPEMIAAVCDRHTGVGADGVIFACTPSGGADAAMRIFNADGSEAEMCGNGIRCLAKFLYEVLSIRKKEMRVETGGGVKVLELSVSGSEVDAVEVDMGLPDLVSRDLPAPDDPSRPGEVTIAAEDGDPPALGMSRGTPHCVLFVSDVAGAPVSRLGPSLETHSLFPARTNVEFVRVDGPHAITMRVWERGVGETMACGTGACAAAVAAINSGRCESPVRVDLPGGRLDIRVGSGGHVYLAGPAVEVFRGELSAAWKPD